MISRTGRVELQNLLDSKFFGLLRDMAELAYPELLQDVNSKDKKSRAMEHSLWKQVNKNRAQRQLWLEWEALHNEVLYKSQRVYFLMGLLAASDFTDRLIEAEKVKPTDIAD